MFDRFKKTIKQIEDDVNEFYGDLTDWEKGCKIIDLCDGVFEVIYNCLDMISSDDVHELTNFVRSIVEKYQH